MLWSLIILVHKLLLAREEGKLGVSEGDELLCCSLGVARIQPQVGVCEVLPTHLTAAHYPLAVVGFLCSVGFIKYSHSGITSGFVYLPYISSWPTQCMENKANGRYAWLFKLFSHWEYFWFDFLP